MSDELETRVIEVTQQDIDEGKRMDCHCCPVALAFKRQIAESVGIDVGSFSVFITFPIACHYRWPRTVSDWIRKFDLGEPSERVEPFTFEMELPKEFWRAA